MFESELKFMAKYIHIFASESGITKVTISPKSLGVVSENLHSKLCKKEMNYYLNGKLQHFSCSLDLSGTEFQKKVWQELTAIPYGENRSYKDVAIKIGGANYARAVGMANNKNPLPIIIPCHRVVGSSGKLVGYALGLDVKDKLLKLEASSER